MVACGARERVEARIAEMAEESRGWLKKAQVTDPTVLEGAIAALTVRER
jgi:hypothetical protein